MLMAPIAADPMAVPTVSGTSGIKVILIGLGVELG